MKLIRIILAALSLPILFLYLLPLIAFLEIKNALQPSVEQARKNEKLGVALNQNTKSLLIGSFDLVINIGALKYEKPSF